MQRDALEFWEAIAGKVKQTVRGMMEKSLQCERYDVTTAPDGSKIGVKQPFGTREIFIPYSAEVAEAKVGDTVLVMWWNSLSTAKAWYFGSGPAASYDGLVSRMLITQQINSLTVDDNTALRMAEFYPEWKDLIGTTVDKAGFKFTHNGQLYKTIPEQHRFQADWVPGEGTESLYTRIDESHAGTLADPIPYSGNMALEAGKYYSQSGVVYLCTRDTVNPVYNPLAELVGLYVEKSV